MTLVPPRWLLSSGNSRMYRFPYVLPVFCQLLLWHTIIKTFQYPSELAAGKFKVVSVRDLTTGYDTTTVDKKAVFPSDPGSQMITFTFDNGVIATLRTSGTEPKLKYYVRAHHMFSRILNILFIINLRKKVSFSQKITVILTFYNLFWFLDENPFKTD